jgi:hypothetical protein
LDQRTAAVRKYNQLKTREVQKESEKLVQMRRLHTQNINLKKHVDKSV